MYPPILVLVLALVTFSKQTLSLETLLQLDSFDGGDVDGAVGAGGDFSSPLYEDTYGPDPEEDRNLNNYQQPAIVLDDIYYRVTPDAGEESEGGKTSVSTSSSTTSTLSIPQESSEEQLSATDRSASTVGSNISDDIITDSGGNVSVAQPFVGEDLLEPLSNRSRSLDHDTADSLQSSTILDTSLTSNFLYTSHYNDSTDGGSAERTSDDTLDNGEDDQLSLATTTAISPLAIPDDVSSVITPTKPHFDESKISKSELLARMIADKNLRLPIAILMDTCNESLSYSKKVFDSSLVPRSPLEVILMRYNSTGIAKSTSFRNTRSLMDAINSLQPSYENSGRAYYGILRTSQEIPYDSAIFLATSNTATDKELSRMAALTLLKKRIRLYVIWFGDEVDTNLSDQHLDSQTGLHELAYKTGGRVIRFELDRHFGNNPVLTTLVSESDLHGHQSIPIPVEEDVNSLYFKLHGALDTATLRTPNGYIIDLLLNTVSQETSGSDQVPPNPSHIPKPSIIATNRSTALDHHTRKNQTVPPIQDYLFIVSRVNTSTSGIYYLNVSVIDVPYPATQLPTSEPGVNISTINSSFSVIVKADYDMRHGIEFLELGDPELERRFDDPSNDVDFVSPRGTGGGNSNAEGRHSLSARKHTRQTESQILAESEESGFIGRAATIQSVTKIDLGLNSQLTGPRGTTITLIFEVTNFRQTPVFYYFRVTDELGFLRSLNPGSATIGPLQTIHVAVTVIIGVNVEIGTRDKITFSTEGPDRISHSAWVTVTEASGIPDAYMPSVWYTYTSRCEGRSDPGRCAGAFWTVDVTARDYETGLLKIASNPDGLVYRTQFTAGTKEEVKGSYTASCCQPMVTISAYDVTRNVRTINLDVRDIWLNEAGIAAVVLGVLLLIALIILLVLLCRYCIKKRRSKELPIYRGELRERRT
ncbi:uncharacterized protein LOC134219671 [Armigeres subalbatus]|uniref:uncharacterized protein LOC134219671 n=1 Tax=Armigeres subalbatus TaxID=124917 RepID=UPI002ED3CFC6